MKNKIHSIKKAYRFINQYKKEYGLFTAFRVLKHYGYRAVKNYQVNSQESTIFVNDCKMIIMPNDPGISTELSIFKSHEPLNTKILSRLIQKDMVCLDIGGNIGYYVLLERKLIGDKGKIVAFEPAPNNFYYLQKNIELQKVDNILAYNFACGDVNGIATFFVNKKSNGCKVIAKGVQPPDPSRGTLTKVKIKIADTIVDELKLDRVDFVRMDAEGYELHIFRGLKQTLQKFRPIISIELHKRQLGIDGINEFFKLMKDLDYEIESYVSRNLDIPMIGSMHDVKKISIDELLDLINKEKVGSYLMLNLIHRKKQLKN